jgi:hypothetical protein
MPGGAARLVLFWITRDADENGVPEDVADVWTERPHRGEAVWLTPTFPRGRFARCSVATLRAAGYTVPDDDRQCVRYG